MVFETDGLQLHFDTYGSGEPLLFLHGFLGCGSNWRYIFPEPPPHFTLIAPDLRGHGSSTNPSDVFSIRHCASDIRALLDHLGIDRCKAIGVSGGGITLLHLAAVPSRVEAMVVVSAPPYYPEQARAIQRVFSDSMISERELEIMRASHQGGEDQLQRLFAHARAFADNYDDVCFTPAQLSAIAAETLIVFGDRDPLYPVSLAVEMRETIPNSYLWVVPNGGHGPVFGDAAPLFASTALSFLRGEWRAA
jgi:pimeloyl-ACP methyl ester carboxylesterase